MTIQKIKSLPEILRTMYICAEVFPNPDHRSKTMISQLAQKYAQLAEFYVMYAENETAGFIAYYCNDDSRSAFVSMLMVREEYQRQGIGRTFLDQVIADCKKVGKDQIRLEVDLDNEKGLSFYKKNGFKKESIASAISDYYVLSLERGKQNDS
jgi:ribosomal protein S18 acetylase RimI-like enzyme